MSHSNDIGEPWTSLSRPYIGVATSQGHGGLAWGDALLLSHEGEGGLDISLDIMHDIMYVYSIYNYVCIQYIQCIYSIYIYIQMLIHVAMGNLVVSRKVAQPATLHCSRSQNDGPRIQ